MTDGQGRGSAHRKPKKVRAELPVLTVKTPAELHSLLAEHRGLLLEQAVIQLGPGPDAEAAVERVVRRLSAMKEVHREHALQWVMQRLREECYRTAARRKAAAAATMPYDPVLDRHLDEAAMATVRELPYGEQEAYVLAVTERMTNEEIAQRLRRPVRAIRMRLYRARKKLKATLPEEGIGGLPALLLARVRTGRRRGLVHWRHMAETAARLADVAPAMQLSLVAVVMAALVTGPTLSVPVHGAGTAGFGAAAARVRTAGPVWSTPAALASRVSVPQPASPRHRAVSADEAAGVIGDLAAGHTAATETPDDTQLVAAAAAPQSEAAPMLVALGVGNTCGCYVLYRSDDGGATWQGHPAPPGADQVVLPPNYPADHRIFLGSPAGGTAPDYVLAGVDGVAVPLPGPPGHLALARGFATGDPRVFVAGRAAVWSLDVQRWNTEVELPYVGAVDSARITTAEGDPRIAIAVAVPAAPSPSVAGTGASTAPGIYLCRAGSGTGCERQGDGPQAGVGELVGAPVGDPDSTLAALGNGSLSRSVDGARSFMATAAPASIGQVSAVALGAGRLWATFTVVDHPTTRLAWFDERTGVWHDVTAADAELSHAVAVITASRGTTLVLLAGGGLRCSVDGGVAWYSRCPSG